MQAPIWALKALISEVAINEIDIEDVEGIKCVAGSTHVMQTCKINKNKYFLKFSDEDLFDDADPSLQILVEYLAYKIYQLYPNVRTPPVELVYDAKRHRVGLASSAVSGKPGLTNVPAKRLGKMLSAGVYVDVLLANWDVVGIGSGNVIVDKNVATRIDPGGSLTFRAQGGRKGSKFSSSPGELNTMLDPSFGSSGTVLRHADLRQAAGEFSSVPWQSISATIKDVAREVSADLNAHGMRRIAKQWSSDVAEIQQKLRARHKEITRHIKMTMSL